MSIDNIIVTTNSFHSHNKHDLITSNIHYITKLFQHHLTEDKVFEDALKSYYVDYYHSHILHGGFYNFIKTFKTKHKVLYYIRTGLKAIKAKRHLKLFNAIFPEVEKKNNSYQCRKLDLLFQKIQKEEELISKNHAWLIDHPKLLIVSENAIALYLERHLVSSTQEKRHITIIKQLCNIIGEEFIAVTAGDINNLYNRAWHFKTSKNYYYTIEKDHIVTLYNSFTKQEVTKGRLVANKTDQSFVSNFISKLLA